MEGDLRVIAEVDVVDDVVEPGFEITGGVGVAGTGAIPEIPEDEIVLDGEGEDEQGQGHVGDACSFDIGRNEGQTCVKWMCYLRGRGRWR